MKRILICGILTAVSMFFTGCTSIITSMDSGGYQEIKWDVIDGDNGSWGSMGLKEGETLPSMEVPDYYAMNEEEKFKGLEGYQAFQIAPEHSQETEDLETFQIGTLLEDGTFIYAYSTKLAGNGDGRAMVHCVAAHQYETGNFRLLHENRYNRNDGDEAGESFYIQMCEASGGGQELFVYDNGMGYLYDAAGNLKFQTDIETFVREHFHKAYSVETTNAVTDGNNRIYVELVLEKENIAVEELEDAESGDDISEEDADKEAEELEDEVEAKTIELILVYDFQTFSSTIDQDNLKFEEQIKAWQEAADGKTFTEHPDAEADWRAVVSSIPDEWGIAYLDYVELTATDKLYMGMLGLGNYSESGVPVLHWKGDKQFNYTNDGYVCQFTVPLLSVNRYEGFQTVETGKSLEDVFILKDGQYYEVYGNVGREWKGYSSKSFSRTYTYKWTTEETDENGKAVTKEHTREYTQTLSRNGSRYASLENEYLEGYWVLDATFAEGLGGVVDNRILCSSPWWVTWLLRNGTYVHTGIMDLSGKLTEEYVIDVFEDRGKEYLVLTSSESIIILNQKWTESGSVQTEDSWAILPEMLQVELKNDDLTGREMTENDKKYVLAHQELEEGNMGGLANLVPSGHFDAAHIRRVTLDQYDGAAEQAASGDGFLLTTLDKGLLFVSPSQGQSVCVKEGTWYGTWRHGDKLVSVGFATDASYGTLDVAHSRVLEYDLNELYRSEQDKDAEEARKKAEEESRKASEEAAARESAAAQESIQETTRSPLENWQELKESKDETTEGLELDNLRDGMNVERDRIEDLTPEELRARESTRESAD